MKTICQHQCDCRWTFRGDFEDFGLYTSHISDEKGTGLRTTNAIEKGEYVLEYTGKCISNENEVLHILESPPPLYILDAGTHWIDATVRDGNLSRYLNHSCNPNLVAEVWESKGGNRIFFRAREYIGEHEELTFNYNSNNHRNIGNWNKQKCYCSEDCPNCL
jgi:SET domain-containing protein